MGALIILVATIGFVFLAHIGRPAEVYLIVHASALRRQPDTNFRIIVYGILGALLPHVFQPLPHIFLENCRLFTPI